MTLHDSYDAAGIVHKTMKFISQVEERVCDPSPNSGQVSVTQDDTIALLPSLDMCTKEKHAICIVKGNKNSLAKYMGLRQSHETAAGE